MMVCMQWRAFVQADSGVTDLGFVKGELEEALTNARRRATDFGYPADSYAIGVVPHDAELPNARKRRKVLRRWELEAKIQQEIERAQRRAEREGYSGEVA